MRRELVVPPPPPRLRIEREHGGTVQIVAFALITVVIGTGVARGPVEQLRLRVVGPRQPRRGAPMRDRAANPRLRPRFARRGHRPEPPDAFARRGAVGVEKSSDAFVPAR